VGDGHYRIAARCLAAILFLSSLPALGADDDAGWVSIDPYLSLETGSDATRAAVRAFGKLEAMASRPVERSRAGGIAFRVARTAFLDLPMAWWFGVLEHEAFGHGGRAREFGARAGFHMGSPWGGRDSYASYSSEGLGTVDLLRISAGGSESNGWTATRMERDLVAGRPVRSLDLLFLASNRWVTTAYVLRTTPDPATDPGGFWREWPSGDVAGYLGRLSELETGDTGITPTGSSSLVRSNYDRLARQARWNMLDPGLWLSLWTAGRAVIRGDEFPRVPLPAVRGRTFLPVLSADWLPDGGAASLELVVGPAARGILKDSPWSSVVIRRGAGPRGRFWAAGAGTETLHEFSALRLGGEIEAWTRPGRSPGGGVRVRLTPTSGRLEGLFAEVGVKSAGSWPGRPAGTGPFVRLGASLQVK
jgi:hypothetical protein